MDQKELISAIEDKVEVAKKHWQSEVDKKGSEFESKLDKALDKLLEESKGFETKNSEKFEEFKKELQKEYDELALSMTEKMTQANKVTFKKAVDLAITKQAEILTEHNARAKNSTVLSLKDMGFENFTDIEEFTTDRRNQVIAELREDFHLRQILTIGQTDGDAVAYPKALPKTGTGPGPWQYNKTTIESTVAKPSFELNFEPMKADVEWIAGILRLPIGMLRSLPWLSSYIATYAPMYLFDAEDNQILNGNGTSPQLDGLIPTADAYDGDYTVGIERIIDAAYGQMPDGLMATDLLINKRDAVGIMLNKADTSGLYNLPEGTVGVVGGRLNIGGLTVHRTSKITAGNFLVGDFRRGAALVIKSAPQLRFFEQDVDNVQKNMMTVRIEEELTLVKFYEEAFIYGALTSS